ncbi:MAG TPA: cation:proton antiporter [Burkholderiales bacterium]|nr:cation:proton antiporter [Burkholderiales bacterium]
MARSRARPVQRVLWASLLVAALPATAWAAASAESAQAFLWVGILLLAGKLGTLVERVGLPAVLGEIVMGIALGNLALVGIDFLVPVLNDPVIGFLAQLGAVILLFQLGLETDLGAMRRVGLRASGVALIGVIVPFVLGTYIVGPMLLPGLSAGAYLFIGAALTATSIGITGRVFRDMGCLSKPEAQIVLGAAVIDDVLGLLILAVVSSIAVRGSVSAGEVASISLLAVGFLLGAVVGGQALASHLSRLFAKLHRGHGMKLAAALIFCFAFAYIAAAIGLAPIVGAFAAGLVLTEAHFRWFDEPEVKRDVMAAVSDASPQVSRRVHGVLEAHAQKHLEHMLDPISHFMVPLFFVLAGMNVKLDVFLDPAVVAVAVMLTTAAIAGKLVAGVAAGRGVNRWVVGWGMVPRGEVGLIFAFVGKSLGVVNDAAFSVIVVMVMLTTLVTPPVLAYLLRGERSASARISPEAAADAAR